MATQKKLQFLEMKSRRRRLLAFLKASDHANPSMITAGICDRRNGFGGSSCRATISSRRCPLWVKSRHP